MSSIITAVFQATIGLLVNKGRDKAAYKLKEGDVTDQKFRVLIVRELDDIKTKLDGLARKDLLASISFFKEGIEFLYEVFDQARFRNECGDVTADLTALSAVATVNNAKTFSLAEGMRKLGLTGMDESATRAFSNAKERFKDARRKATEAFNNEASVLPDRILAMQYRVMSTILETLDNPRDAIPACRVCIEELHSLPAVQKCFDVELKKGFWALFSKDERRKIISSVCHVNRVMYDVTLMVGRGEPGLNCSLVDIDSANQIDPLRDRRVTPVLHEVGMEHCCVIWSFGQEGIGEHKLNDPRDIATNSQGQFIIADMVVGNIKIFDRSGKFLHDFCVTANANLCIYDVAIDRYDNSYVLVRNPTKPGHEDVLYVFDHTSKLRHNFPLLANGAWYYRVSVNMANGKVLLLGRLKAKYVVDLYESDGQFVRRFGERILRSAEDITAANNDRVIVVDRCDLRVHVFSEKGDHLKQFMLLDDYYSHRIAFHWASQQVVVTGQRDRKDGRYIYIYSVDGELLRSIHVDEKCCHFTGITVTTEGSIAVTFQEKNHEGKVLVL